MAHPPLLADARLVLEQEADAPALMCIRNCLEAFSKPP
jgi:hypothetical protein